jgi:5,10-methylenetetrahydromethanopterin reductase
MRFGLSFASQLGLIDTAVRAEALGYHSIHFYDTPLVCADPYVVAGLAATRTERIQISISVAIPYLRLPHVLATSVGTLNMLAPGRINLGFGSGYTGAQTTGSRPDTWATIREHVRVCRALLRGEEVETTIKGECRIIKHLHPDRDFVDLETEVPIWISATGPKGMATTAEIADGLITLAGARRATATEFGPRIAEFRRHAAAAGKPDMPVSLVTAMAVRGPGEPLDSPRLLGYQGPWVTSHLHGDLGGGSTDPNTPAIALEAVAAYRELRDRMRPDAPWIENHRGHSTFVRPDEQHILSGELINAVSQIGTAEELIAEIRELEQAGIDEIVWQVIPGYEDEVERFAREVMEPYDATVAARAAPPGKGDR